MREAEEIAEKASELEREANINTLIVADSNFRHKRATTAKINVATGAKIGHAANVLKFENLNQFDNVVLHVGQNNISPQDDASAAIWGKNLRFEIGELTRELSSFEGTTRIVKVPESQHT